MTIDEMIAFVKNATPLGSYPSGSRDQIIAALRAGQQMSEGVMKLGGMSGDGGKTWIYRFYATHTYHEGKQAWDAATKGEEG